MTSPVTTCFIPKHEYFGRRSFTRRSPLGLRSRLAIWFMGSDQFNERCGCPSLWSCICLLLAFTYLN